MAYRRGNEILFSQTVTGLWLILSGFAVVWASSALWILALALLCLTATMALSNIFRFAGGIAAVLGSLAFVAALVYTQGMTEGIILPAAVLSVSLLGTALLGALHIRAVWSASRQLENDQKLIGELRANDPDTLLLRFPYARRALKTEVARCQRYKKDLALILFQVANWKDIVKTQGPTGISTLRKQIASVLKDSLRDVDTPFSDDDRMGVLLPETDLAGALTVSERLVHAFERKLRLAVHTGVVHYPEDGVTDDDLLHAAEAALQLSLASGESSVPFSRIHSAVAPADRNPVSSDGAAADEDVDAEDGSAARPVVARREPPAPPEGRKTIVRIDGLTQVGDTLRVEKAVAAQPGVMGVHTLQYADHALILDVEHQVDNLAQVIKELVAIPVQSTREGKEWIELKLEPGDAGQK